MARHATLISARFRDALVVILLFAASACATGPAARPAASPTAPVARETPVELLTPTPSPSFSPTPSPIPDPVTAYRALTMPIIDQLYRLGQTVTATCAPVQATGCRGAFQSLFDASATATTNFDTWTYPSCLVGFHTVLRATAVGYHNAAIQGLASLDSRGLFDYQPALKSIAVEEDTITKTRLFDIDPECFR